MSARRSSVALRVPPETHSMLQRLAEHRRCSMTELLASLLEREFQAEGLAVDFPDLRLLRNGREVSLSVLGEEIALQHNQAREVVAGLRSLLAGDEVKLDMGVIAAQRQGTGIVLRTPGGKQRGFARNIVDGFSGQLEAETALAEMAARGSIEG